jgi:hypothetical protein
MPHKVVPFLVALELAILLVPTAIGTGPLGTGGTLLAIGHASITIGRRPEQVAWDKAFLPKARLRHNLTCRLVGDSPALARFHVGEYVVIRCSSGKLVSIHADWQWAGGEIVKLDADSIEIGSPPGLRCSFGPSSPGTDKYHVGDQARIACLGGMLKRILPGSNGWNGYVESGGGSYRPPSTAGF